MGATMDEAELSEIERRCAAARPGPWVSCVPGRDHQGAASFLMIGFGGERGIDIELTGATVADQDFIAAAREDVPRLVAEIRRLRALVGGR